MGLVCVLPRFVPPRSLQINSQQHVLRLFSREQHGRPDSHQPSDVSEGENDVVIAVDGDFLSCFLGVANRPRLYPPPPSAVLGREPNVQGVVTG